MENTLTLKDLQDWIKSIENIIIDINISIKNIERLSIDKYEFENQIKEHGFFKHHFYQLKFIITIQLCKILSNKNNEKRSFVKLFNSLENKKFDPDLRNLLIENRKNTANIFKSKDDINNWIPLARIDMENHLDLIKNIVLAREEIYAHTDPAPKVPYISLETLQILSKVASNLLNELQFNFFFTTTELNYLYDWDIDYIIWHISEVKKFDIIEKNKKLSSLK